MLVNLEGAQVMNVHGHNKLVLDLDKQFDEKDMHSLNVQQLFTKQQNPSFLALDEEDDDLMNLSSNNLGTAINKRAALWKQV